MFSGVAASEGAEQINFLRRKFLAYSFSNGANFFVNQVKHLLRKYFCQARYFPAEGARKFYNLR